MSKHTKRIDQPLTSWMQDAEDMLAKLRELILSGEIYEEHLDRERRYDLEISCRSAIDAVDGALLDLKERAESEFQGDPYKELRHSQYERL